MRGDPPPAPVFVDHSGTRRRWLTVFGVLTGAVLSLVTAVLVAGVLGGGPGYLPGLPGPAPDGGRAAGSAAPTGPTPGTSRPPRRGSSPSPRVPATGSPTASPSPAGPRSTATPGNPGHGNPHASQSRKK
jgi:hypothetical protein